MPPDIIEKLNAIIPPRENLGDDSPTWADSSDGEFLMKNMYDNLGVNLNLQMDTELCNSNWKWQGPLRIQVFMWKCLHGKLPTNEERLTRGMSVDPTCCRCSDQSESIMHSLRDCPTVMEFWNSLVHEDHWATFFSLGIRGWLKFNLSVDASKGQTNFDWKLI
ncbi:Reverse transcriptase zinc-binding domain [Sesbania bispinosa]|nr:Reverse transcriptase zinc-binding domain [Sesbania bispinosa]